MNRRTLLNLALLIFIGSFLSLSIVTPVDAQAPNEIEVTSDYDSSSNPDEFPASNNLNDCSLREAIQNANDNAATYLDCAAGAADDLIVFDASVTTITLDGRISVISEIRIDGDASTDQNYSDNVILNGSNGGVFVMNSSDGDLTLDELTIQNSDESAILQSSGVLTCNLSRFQNNTDSESGGAIDSSGATTIIDIDECVFNDNSASDDGGAIVFTGALLTISNSAFLNNEAGTDTETGDTNGGSGGALYRGGSQTGSTLTGVYFSNNIANTGADSVDNVGGGAIYNRTSDNTGIGINGMVILANSFAGNQANGSGADGGAIFNDGGNMLISYSNFGEAPLPFTIPSFLSAFITISAPNTAEGFGGAVHLAGGALTDIVGSSFFGNTAFDGGGIYVNASDRGTGIYNSTLNDNTASDSGGGIFLAGTDDEVLIVNATISDNNAASGGGISNGGDGDSPGGGGFVGRIDYPESSDFDDAIIANTILSGNSTGNCNGASLSDGLGNVTSTDACAGLTTALLGSANLGSPELTFSLASIITYTRPLQAGSAALGAGRNEICDDLPYPLNLDQRVFPRPVGDVNCDAGAYESDLVGATPTPTATATFTATDTATITNTPTATSTPTDTPTGTPSGTATDTPTGTPSGTPSGTATDTPTGTPSGTATDTPTGTPSGTPSGTATDTPTGTPSGTATDTPTGTTSPTASGTATDTPTGTTSPTASGTATDTPTGTTSPTVTQTATASPTIDPSLSPTVTQTATASPTIDPSLSPTATQTATASPTIDPSLSPTATQTATASPTIDPSLSPTATQTATASPTIDPSLSPTVTQTPSPTTPGSNPTPVIVIVDPFITKSVNPPFAVNGEIVTWTITITNPGTVPSNNVTTTDTMPDVVQIQSVNATAGTINFNGQVVTFMLASLAPGQTVTITIVTRVRDDAVLPFVVINTATLTSSTGSDSATATLTGVNELPATGEPLDFAVRWGGVIALGIAAFGLLWLMRKSARTV